MQNPTHLTTRKRNLTSTLQFVTDNASISTGGSTSNYHALNSQDLLEEDEDYDTDTILRHSISSSVNLSEFVCLGASHSRTRPLPKLPSALIIPAARSVALPSVPNLTYKLFTQYQLLREKYQGCFATVEHELVLLGMQHFFPNELDASTINEFLPVIKTKVSRTPSFFDIASLYEFLRASLECVVSNRIRTLFQSFNNDNAQLLEMIVEHAGQTIDFSTRLISPAQREVFLDLFRDKVVYTSDNPPPITTSADELARSIEVTTDHHFWESVTGDILWEQQILFSNHDDILELYLQCASIQAFTPFFRYIHEYLWFLSPRDMVNYLNKKIGVPSISSLDHLDISLFAHHAGCQVKWDFISDGIRLANQLEKPTTSTVSQNGSVTSSIRSLRTSSISLSTHPSCMTAHDGMMLIIPSTFTDNGMTSGLYSRPFSAVQGSGQTRQPELTASSVPNQQQQQQLGIGAIITSPDTSSVKLKLRTRTLAPSMSSVTASQSMSPSIQNGSTSIGYAPPPCLNKGLSHSGYASQQDDDLIRDDSLSSIPDSLGSADHTIYECTHQQQEQEQAQQHSQHQCPQNKPNYLPGRYIMRRTSDSFDVPPMTRPSSSSLTSSFGACTGHQQHTQQYPTHLNTLNENSIAFTAANPYPNGFISPGIQQFMLQNQHPGNGRLSFRSDKLAFMPRNSRSNHRRDVPFQAEFEALTVSTNSPFSTSTEPERPVNAITSPPSDVPTAAHESSEALPVPLPLSRGKLGGVVKQRRVNSHNAAMHAKANLNDGKHSVPHSVYFHTADGRPRNPSVGHRSSQDGSISPGVSNLGFPTDMNAMQHDNRDQNRLLPSSAFSASTKSNSSSQLSQSSGSVAGSSPFSVSLMPFRAPIQQQLLAASETIAEGTHHMVPRARQITVHSSSSRAPQQTNTPAVNPHGQPMISQPQQPHHESGQPTGIQHHLQHRRTQSGGTSQSSMASESTSSFSAIGEYPDYAAMVQQHAMSKANTPMGNATWNNSDVTQLETQPNGFMNHLPTLFSDSPVTPGSVSTAERTSLTISPDYNDDSNDDDVVADDEEKNSGRHGQVFRLAAKPILHVHLPVTPSNIAHAAPITMRNGDIGDHALGQPSGSSSNGSLIHPQATSRSSQSHNQYSSLYSQHTSTGASTPSNRQLHPPFTPSSGLSQTSTFGGTLGPNSPVAQHQFYSKQRYGMAPQHQRRLGLQHVRSQSRDFHVTQTSSHASVHTTGRPSPTNQSSMSGQFPDFSMLATRNMECGTPHYSNHAQASSRTQLSTRNEENPHRSFYYDLDDDDCDDDENDNEDIDDHHHS